MKLNIIIPTYNRADSLKKTLQSLADAEKPAGLEVEILVADNNSSDHTPQIFEDMKSHFPDIKYAYMFEKEQGRSFALNSAIKMVDGDLISTIDDDEVIDTHWFVEVEKLFSKRWDEIDFAGGKILPDLEAEPPVWLEPMKEGALCWRDYGDEEWVYGKETPMITGAHGIFKASIFKDVGGYDENVGVRGKGFISGEDEVFYDALIGHNKRGVYNPKMVMYHYVPKARMDKNYYRRWLFGVGISRYLVDAAYENNTETKLLGVPRWMYRTAVKGVVNKLKFIVKRDETEALAAENRPIVFAGYFYAKNLQNSPIDRILQFFGGKLFKSADR